MTSAPEELPVAEILTIGDELLSGETVDTNASWLDARLEAWGYRVARHTSVPDDVDAIAEAMREATSRAELVISSGGLGPTQDDLTLEALARALGCGLHSDARTLERIAARFARFQRAMTPNNERQARVPEVGEVLDNEVGTAPGFVAPLGRGQIFLVPGVPREMRHFADEVIGPRVRRGQAAWARRTVRTVGLGESRLEHEIAAIVAAHGDVRFGYRTLGIENHVKLAARDPAALDPVERALRETLGAAVFGVDDETLERAVVVRLRERGEHVALAESCSGGLVASRIVEVAGASRVFVGGVVAYANSAKSSALGVDPGLIERHGAVSVEVAESMAVGARLRLGAEWGVSTTGIAGPDGGTAEKPVGLVHLGIAGPEGARVETLRLLGDRAQIRLNTATSALGLLWRSIRASS